MIKQIVVLCVLLYTLAPVQGYNHIDRRNVNRLYVDEITGYTIENVTATQVDAGLLVVDYETVVNGVIADAGDRDNLVDTPGKISLNGGIVNFQATSSVEITSASDNVAFSGKSLNINAVGGVNIETQDFTITSGVVRGTIGGTFGTNAVRQEFNTIGDILLTAGGNLFLSSQDRIRLESNGIAFDTLGSTTFASAESNIFLSSYLYASLYANNNLAYVSDSGLEIGSSHGFVTLDVSNAITIRAENYFERATSIATHRVYGDALFNSLSTAGDIWLESERIAFKASSADLTFTTTAPQAVLAFVTSGGIETLSSTFDVNGASRVLVLSIDGIHSAAADSTTITANDSFNYLASAGVEFQGENIDASSQASIQLSAFGQVYFNSLFNDIVFDSVTALNFTSGSGSLFKAHNQFLLNSVGTNIVAQYAQFESSTNEFVTANSVDIRASNTVVFQGQDDVTTTSRDTTVTASSIFIAAATRFINSDNFNIVSNSSRTTTRGDYSITSANDINIQSTTTFYNGVNNGHSDFNTGDTFNLESSIISTFASTAFTASTLGDFTLDAAGNVLFRGATSAPGVGIINTRVYQSDYTATSTSRVTVDVTSGNAVFSTVDDTLISADNYNITASKDILISTSEQAAFGFGSQLTVTAPVIVASLPTNIDGGGITIIAPGQTTVNGNQNIDVTAVNLYGDKEYLVFNGGAVNINTDGDFVIGDLDFLQQQVYFEVSNEKDLVFSANDYTFNAGDDFNLRGGNFVLETPTTFDVTIQSGRVSANDTFVFTVDNSADFTAAINDIDIDRFHRVSFLSGNDINLSTRETSTYGIDDDDFETNLYHSSLLDVFGKEAIRTSTTVELVTANDATYTTDSFDVFSSQTATIIGFDSEAFYYNTVNLNQNDIILNSDRIEFNAVNKVEFKTADSDITITTSTLSIVGGAVQFIAYDTFAFSAGGIVELGNIDNTVANPNNRDAIVDIGSDFTIAATTGDFTAIATGNELYDNEAIRYDVVGTSTFEAGTDFIADGNNGIRILSGELTSSSGEDHVFSATEGAIILSAFEPNTAVNDIVFISDGDIISTAQRGRTFFSAYTDIASSSDSYTLSSAFEITMSTFIEHESATYAVSFTSGGDQSWTAGKNWQIAAGNKREISSDITVTSTASSSVTNGGNARIRALEDQVPGAAGGKQIFLQGGKSGGEAEYLVQAGNELSLWPSGTMEVNLFSALYTGGLNFLSSFGSISNDFALSTTSVALTSARDIKVSGGGVEGDVTGDFSSVTFTVGGNLTLAAAGDAEIVSTEATTVDAATINYSTNQDQGSIQLFGDEVTLLADLGDIFTLSENFDSFTSGATTIDSPLVFFGADNQFTPQMNVLAAAIDITSVGDVAISATESTIDEYTFTAYKVDAQGNAVYTTGGIARFAATDSNSDAGGAFTIDVTDVATITAANFIEVATVEDSSITSGGSVSILSKGTRTGAGIFVDTKNSVSLTASTSITQNIRTNVNILAGTGKVSFEDRFETDAGSLEFNSDGKLTFSATDALAIFTTAQSSRIELVASGQNGDIEIATQSTTLSSKTDAFFIVDSFEQRGDGDATFSIAATSSASGRVFISASDDVVFQAFKDSDGNSGAIIVNTQDDQEYNALGADSELSFTGASYTGRSDADITFTTDPDEGGSIIFSSVFNRAAGAVNNVDIAVVGNWDGDVDGDLIIDAPAIRMVFDDDFDLAAQGYININADELVTFEILGDLQLTAENGDVEFYAEGPARFSYTNVISSSDRIDFVVRGNETATTRNALSFGGNTIAIDSREGGVYFGAANQINIASGTNTFISDADIINPAVSLSTTERSADFLVRGGNTFIYGNNGAFNAFGDDYESGYIKIIANNAQAQPSIVNIVAGQEIAVVALDGDIRAETSGRFIIAGGDIHGVAGGAIEFNVRGDGHNILPTGQVFGAVPVDPTSAIQFSQINSVQFETERDGYISIISKAGEVAGFGNLFYANSDLENIYLESSGSLSFQSDRPRLASGIQFDSTGHINFHSYDEDVIINGYNLLFSAPHASRSVQIRAGAGGSVTINNVATAGGVSSIFATDGTLASASVNILAMDGDVNIESFCPNANAACGATADMRFLGAQAVNVLSSRNIYLQYTEGMTINAATINIQAGTGDFGPSLGNYDEYRYNTDPQDDGYIRLSGNANSIPPNTPFVPPASTTTQQDNTGSTPIVYMPNTVAFQSANDITNVGPTSVPHFSMGGYCAVNRQISFGRSTNTETDRSPRSYFCVCIENTWSCAPSESNLSEPGLPFTTDQYSYQTYNFDQSTLYTSRGNY